MGQLQELDRLQELRRHHQALRLTNLEPLRQTHRNTPAQAGPAPLHGTLFA